MSACFLLMIWEYYVLRGYTARVRLVIEQYDSYIDTAKRFIKKQKEEGSSLEATARQDGERNVHDEDSDEDEMAIDSFMVINRTPEYLKESTVSYLKNQQLNSVLNEINVHEWHDYTDQVSTEVSQPARKKTGKKNIKHTSAAYATVAPWRTAKGKRVSLTGITFALPIEQSKFWISSFFGPRKKPAGKKSAGKWSFHYGIDMAAQRGTPVKAAASGVVEQAGYSSGYGNTVVITHDKFYKTRYAHLDAINVKVGQKVAKNQKVGKVGDTGFTIKTGKDASHLHFELYERGKQINPLYLLA